jgi:hypothetical protein
MKAELEEDYDGSGKYKNIVCVETRWKISTYRMPRVRCQKDRLRMQSAETTFKELKSHGLLMESMESRLG